MRYERLELKNYFEFLGKNGANPTLDIYLPYNMVEMNRQNQKRPCMVICPGGGYSYTNSGTFLSYDFDPGAAGGLGSSGGQGADGFILVYYKA